MLSSSKPYLIRAIYEWIADNNMTPYILVDAFVPSVYVPDHVINNGRVVLNISMSATRDLELANDAISFSARIGGKSESIYLPISSILEIYSAENQEGMAFAEYGETLIDTELDDDFIDAESSKDEPGSNQSDKPRPKPTKPSLKIIK
ncbi:MAG: ClpXP protease specificity-enhancing factor [bacterium]